MNLSLASNASSCPSSKAKGFSLVEMVVVVAVIGVLAAIALPMFGNTPQSAKEVKSKQNAQQLCAVYSAAQTAGYDFYDGRNDIFIIADCITKGAIILEGPFKGAYFGLELSMDQINDALPYLQYRLDQKLLTYVEAGVPSAQQVIP